MSKTATTELTPQIAEPMNLQHYQTRIEQKLATLLHASDVPERLRDAMNYSLLAGGKRIRATLVYAAGISCDAPLTRLDAIAAALECIHAYSLIHDDLPAMDDDDLRRGKPSNHIQFDQATAILAGDALQTLAFEIIAAPNSELDHQQCRAIILQLAQSAGGVGMVGGQSLDMLATQQHLTREQLENIHQRKTGALISAAVLCGALAGDALSPQKQQALHSYAANLGLAFQVVDDILDIESSTAVLGKASGADQSLGKATYPAIMGLEKSKQTAEKLYQQAIASVTMMGDNTQLLTQIAEQIIRRKH